MLYCCEHDCDYRDQVEELNSERIFYLSKYASDMPSYWYISRSNDSPFPGKEALLASLKERQALPAWHPEHLPAFWSLSDFIDTQFSTMDEIYEEEDSEDDSEQDPDEDGCDWDHMSDESYWRDWEARFYSDFLDLEDDDDDWFERNSILDPMLHILGYMFEDLYYELDSLDGIEEWVWFWCPPAEE